MGICYDNMFYPIIITKPYILFCLSCLAASKTSIHIYPGRIIQTVVGRPLVIECIQNSPLKSSVTWSKVTALGTRTLVNGSGFANLIFDSVQKSDAGKYRCLATNGAEETVLVSVGGKKYFVSEC